MNKFFAGVNSDTAVTLFIEEDDNEVINWTIYDDSKNGKYRILMNDSAEHSIVWRDWWYWINETLIQVPINSTTIGIYDYKPGL